MKVNKILGVTGKTTVKILMGLLILSLLACGGNSDVKPYDNQIFSDLPLANMISYKGIANNDGLYRSGTFALINQLYQDKASFVFYAGEDGCPWCLDIAPVLYEVAQEVAKKQEITVIYLNMDEEIPLVDGRYVFSEYYAEFVELFNKYLDVDEYGEKTLFIPFVVFVKNGKVIYHNIGTIDGHDAHERPLNDSETEKIKKRLHQAFNKLLS